MRPSAHVLATSVSSSSRLKHPDGAAVDLLAEALRGQWHGDDGQREEARREYQHLLARHPEHGPGRDALLALEGVE